MEIFRIYLCCGMNANQTQIPPQELPRHSQEHLSVIHCVATQLKSENIANKEHR